MDIDAASYPGQLLSMLDAISHADFVAIDLEMTGIPSRMPKPEKPYSGRRKGLEDFYAECKAAADRYCIPQIGITCARFDWLEDRYVLTPYNITLSPAMEERLGFEREISIQSGALSFLLNHGLDFNAFLGNGVQYLSQEEAARAKRIADDRIDKKNEVEDVLLKEQDVQSLDFVRRVREAIVTWDYASTTVLEITTHTGLQDNTGESTISRFEKRLVYQLIRAEFPELMAYNRGDAFYIKKVDVARETEFKKRQKDRSQEQIAKQTGFRWIFEALSQGDISSVDPLRFRNFNILPASDSGVKDRFDLVQDRLRKKQPVLVGHNMFTDLTYFYRTFVGPLPDTLEQFRVTINNIFPRIVDTKYLATHAEGDLNNSPPLNEIASKLKNQALPEIVLKPGHNKYEGKEAYHEAGFDSMVTAQIMIRLAAKIHHEQQLNLSSSNDSNQSFTTARDFSPDSPDPSLSAPMPVSPPIPTRLPDPPKLELKSSPQIPASRFQSQNKFDALSTPEDEADVSSFPGSADNDSIDGKEASWGRTTPSWDKQVDRQPDSTTWHSIVKRKRKPMEMMPLFDDVSFWGAYGNMLRVFGTQERELALGDWSNVKSWYDRWGTA